MTPHIEITNHTLYKETIDEVDLNDLQVEDKGTYGGGLSIKLKGGNLFPYYGLIKKNEFEEEFGFIINH